MIRPVSILVCCGLGILISVNTDLWGGEAALHQRVDELIEARAGGPLAKRASDAEFLRRVYLDLAGTIPSLEQAQEFLNDTTVDKRVALIDRLLGSPEFPKRMSSLFHVMLMERLGDDEAWASYLQDSFAAGKPWSQMVRELANPDAEDEQTRRIGILPVEAIGELWSESCRLSRVGARCRAYVFGSRRSMRSMPRSLVC